jgi:4-amino-4-deoxy-L-arabinose transferase-like glycosyltransferase
MNKTISNHARLFTGVFFFFITLLLLYHLDARTFRLWDEARLALNAANMFIDKNYYYTTYQNAPDFWNTKPHLLILLQVISMKLFGFTEGSVRLPSAIATLLSCGLVFYWMRKENYTCFYACLAVLAFIGTRFLSYHGARAGDYEALLILWQLLYCYAFFQYIQSQRLSFLWLGFITLTLAVLTKGIAGLLFAPGIAVFILLKNKLGLFFKCKSFYLGVFFFLVCILGYYWMHNILTPGYLSTVYANEIGGRYFNALESHGKNHFFYLKSFSLISFYFLPIFIICIGYLLWNRTLWRRNSFLQYLSILSAVFFLVISFSKTKLAWYAYPLYPMVGMIIAILSYELSQTLIEKWQIRWQRFLTIWMILASITAVIAMLASTREKPNMASYLKNHFSYRVPHDYKLVLEDISQYDASLDFQIMRYWVGTQHQISKVRSDQIHVGDWVIMSDELASKVHIPLERKSYSLQEKVGIYQGK